MKRLFCLLALLGVGLAALAQGEGKDYVAHGRAYHADDTAVVRGSRGVGWVRSHLLDDWFVQLQGGGQLYYGTDDREGPFADRLTGNAELRFGRRVFPMMGIRGGVGYGYAHGFLTKEHYDAYGASILGHGFSGQCGTDANGNPLGGYYYDYDDNLLIQKWKYFYVGADVFLDLAFFRGTKRYDPYRKWNNIMYAGVDTKWGLSETDTSNHRTEFHVGYIGKYNISPNWSVYADLRLSLIERLFDREWVPVVESSGMGLDAIANVHIGVNYKFHARSDDERDLFTRANRNEIVDAMTYVSYVKMEETFEMSIVDTLLKYQTINTPTPETRALIDSLQHEIDSSLAGRKARVEGQPLDSILLNRLLPYEMVFFEKDKWEILPSEESKIEKMARIMKAYPNEKFLLTGSADSKTGTPQRNQFLSVNRANVVFNTLVNMYGIDPKQLKTEYLGGILDYQPYQLNRCTVIIMDHPTVSKAFQEIKAAGRAGGGEVGF